MTQEEQKAIQPEINALLELMPQISRYTNLIYTETYESEDSEETLECYYMANEVEISEDMYYYLLKECEVGRCYVSSNNERGLSDNSRTEIERKEVKRALKSLRLTRKHYIDEILADLA
jgi:hypothetical protein